MILSTCHSIFIFKDITTYLKIKHIKEIKIFGNPFYKIGFCKNIKYIFRLNNTKYKFVNFSKTIYIKTDSILESEKVKFFKKF